MYNERLYTLGGIYIPNGTLLGTHRKWYSFSGTSIYTRGIIDKPLYLNLELYNVHLGTRINWELESIDSNAHHESYIYTGLTHE